MTPTLIITIVWSIAMLMLFYAGFSRWLIRWRHARARSRAARVPAELIGSPPRRVKDLAMGESGYILAALVDVDLEGRAFLRDGIEISGEPADSRRDRITRTEAGIVLTLRTGDLPAYRREALYISGYTKYLPVVEIRIEETPEASS
jgi:hypothetical protein